MGRPTWLLNRAESEWRWLLERDDSPWYPSLRLFRQRTPRQWSEPLAAVQAAVQKVADQVLAHGKADLRFERVERLDLEAEQFVETEFVLEDFAQGGFEAGLLFGGAAGEGRALDHGGAVLA